MGNVFYFAWESNMIKWMQANMEGFGVTLAFLVSVFGEEMMFVAILGFLYWCWDKRLGLSVGLSLLTASLWNPMAKNAALRLRPYMADPEIRCLKAVEPRADIMDVAAQGYSFPSGHSCGAAATYVKAALGLKKRIFLILAVALTFLVGFSRITLGVHYPTDVLAGWGLGLLAVLVTGILEKRIQNRTVIYLILIAVALPGIFYCHTNDYFSSLGMMGGLALGELFERKFVRFQNTRKIVPMILRTLGGFALFVGLNTVLKMPFSKEFLESASAASFAVRSLRYLIIIFVMMGPYPMLFKLFDKKGSAEGSVKEEN